ncbi:STAS domain-containing protein [Legionella jordanis]|uniref:Anti-anti-sigma factor n=1 Tax=Legionella jordanis TaxID=456 RepID=A0A0W0V9L9_9GAMM|nr:STAS domain-containing protein [Legionella jordanis]KTD16329.1 anti-anti-sigma factor [Legionella jordanis]VEH12213.1 anti-anti-sigma factor [Legionella jordanis]
MDKQAFKPSAEMTFSTVSRDCERLVKYFRELKEDVIQLDLSGVKHCDSAGLALLIEAKRLSATKKKRCEIHNIPKAVETLAEFCGVGSILGQS